MCLSVLYGYFYLSYEQRFWIPFFNLKRGVRPGCPLSGLLLLLGIELLNLVIQMNSNIKKINVGEEEIKIPYMQMTLLFFSEI